MIRDIPDLADYEDHHQRLYVARAVALWYIGDGEWADLIVDAYLNPNKAKKELEASMDE